MADALVSIVLEKLGSIVLDGMEEEVRLKVGVRKEIRRLMHTLTMIQSVLQDAENKQVMNKVVKFWLEDFKDISYDAEDILDEWSTRSLIQKVQHPDLNAPVIRKVPSQLFNLFSCFKPIVIRHDIGNTIRELNERLVEVVEKIQLNNLMEIRSNDQLQHRPITSDLVVVEEIYGRDVDKDLILTKLLDESAHHNSHVPVISIVGTGGFGKTTLAQLILDQTKQLSNFKFDKHMWVCVSNPFNLEKVAKEIIEQAKGQFPIDVRWPVLHESLYESVHEKCFILVLDDVWSHNGSDWRQLKLALDGGAKGSRILITTRNERVAMMMDSSYTHLLGQMSDDDCWSLFKRIAFFRREDDLYKFEDIGKAISKKCNGVPLTAKVIASLVRYKKTRHEWRAILASNIWEVQEGISSSILSSYNELPSYLKPCLMYCVVLPKDSNIEKEEMVKLWMAQGYLGSDDDGSADLERNGREYFDNLAMLSFFQDFYKDGEGNIIGCKMQDLVRDFVQLLIENETKIILEEEQISSVKVRHLCAGDLNWPSVYQQKNLRTLRIHPKKNNILALELLHQLTCLRALSLRGCGIQEFPNEVEKLLHLRYLDLSFNNKLEELPKTICNLVNLQTLDLRGCSNLIRLPEAIAKLSSRLRHLHIEGCDNLKYMPMGVGKLMWLRSLDEFIVGGCDKESTEKGCTIEELRLLNRLEGCLKITGLDASNAAQAELKMKKMLRSLKMIFRKEEEMVVGMEGILEDLEPHPNLEKLKLTDYKGIKLPNWIFAMSNLTELKLKNLPKCSRLPALGKLKSLEVLHLDGLDSVKRLGSEFYGLDDNSNIQVIFPKLKVLVLRRMEDCEEWDLPILNGVDFFPNLIQLQLERFGGVLPALEKLKSLEILELSRIHGLKHSFDELFGIPTMTNDIVVFPALKYLSLLNMTSWEEKAVIMRKEGEEEKGCNTCNGITIMPCLSKLMIGDCPKLKIIPFYMFSHELKDLVIQNCPQLIGLQPSLPPLLEKLTLAYDVGIHKTSLPLFLHNNNYPNLHYFKISSSSQPSLPQGFNKLTSLQKLVFSCCKILEFEPEDLKHLTMLEELRIDDCPILAERFRGGDISSSSSHVYNIVIRPDLINVHTGITCENCEMKPIVGKRYKCKDCWDKNIRLERGSGFNLCEKCYNTPSTHTYLVDQHHRPGHTFGLITNHGDSPVPVHPDDPSQALVPKFTTSRFGRSQWM